MLKELRKFFNNKEEDVTMSQTTQTSQTPVEDTAQVVAQAGQLEAANTELASQLAASVEQNTQLASQVQALQEQLATLVAASEAAAAKLKADKEAARLSQIKAAVGDVKADGLMAATAGLDDAAFAAVVGALANSVNVEAQTPAFKETGAELEVNQNAVEEGGDTLKFIKARADELRKQQVNFK